MIRAALKSATGSNVWLRYGFLAPWRLIYAASTAISRKNISGECNYGPQEIRHYAETVFSNYRLCAGVERFHGRVAEVGPGDVLGIAALLLADGCSRVDQIDRFTYNGVVDSRVCRYTAPAESFFRSHTGYDFILSCAVMEHLYDPITALRTMAAALNPGGTMIHVVDCRDHGQFSDRLHDLSFLRIPTVLYKPLTLASGLNRMRCSAYRVALESLGLSCKILVTSLSGVSAKIEPALEFEQLDDRLVEQSRSNLDSIRNQLARPFRSMDERDLLIAGFVLVARH